MEKRKHELEVLNKSYRVACAEKERIAAAPAEKDDKKRAVYMAVKKLTESIGYAERAGVDFEGGVEP